MRFNFTLGLVLAMLLTFTAEAASIQPRTKFQKVVYLSSTGASTNTGLNPGSPKSFADQDLWAIPAGTVIEQVYVLVDTAITGTTVLEVGDDDDPDGFIKDMAAAFGSVAMVGWDAKSAYKGAYLFLETAGATDAADIYRVPNAKYYSAAGKEVKLNITTTNTAGKARVVIEGYYASTY